MMKHDLIEISIDEYNLHFKKINFKLKNNSNFKCYKCKNCDIMFEEYINSINSIIYCYDDSKYETLSCEEVIIESIIK